MEVEKAKRKRGKNFSEQEVVILLELLQAQRHILENKRSDAVTWRQKKLAWKKLAELFSARTGLKREWKTLRDKFESLKRKSNRTGCGLNSKGNISTTAQKVAVLLGNSVTELENTFDGNACLANTPEGDRQNKRLNTEKLDQKSLPAENVDHSVEWSSWNPSSLKKSKSTKYLKHQKRLQDEKITLTFLQQKFYVEENRRAEEKHQQELSALKLKNELLQVQVQEKKVDLNLSSIK